MSNLTNRVARLEVEAAVDAGSEGVPEFVVLLPVKKFIPGESKGDPTDEWYQPREYRGGRALIKIAAAGDPIWSGPYDSTRMIRPQ
jgi:hypothetical protein